MEPGETSLGGLEMRKMMKCNGVAVKWQSSYFHLLMFVSTLVYTVRVDKRCTQETVHLEGHGFGRNTGGGTLVAVGLADNAGLALDDSVNIVKEVPE